ncbi:MAG: hypothetical protein HQM14_10405 [SAR324 cluster bacterium]|nr:hypothetical protein [SAR324 cluster bacterium]
MLNLSFFDQLEDEQKQWMTYAIAGMVGSDGVIDRKELNDLGQVLLHMESIEKAESLMTMLKNKLIPRLPAIEVKDRKIATRMIFALAKVAIVDDNLSPKEADYLVYAGAVLNFPKDYIKEILLWAKAQSGANKAQTEIARKGQSLDLHDATLIGEYLAKVDAKAVP